MLNTAVQEYERIESWLLERLGELTGEPPEAIDLDRAFADYQLDSSVAVTLARELARWLGRELPLTLIWEYPNVRTLAAGLSGVGSA